jgi:hypothetical protein
MGKCKKRMLRGTDNPVLTRETALEKIIFACKKNKITEKEIDLITLFGFSNEDLLEGGCNYENVVALKGILNA